MLSSVHKYEKPKPISLQNQKLTQQHNWKKSSSSPREASVLADWSDVKNVLDLSRNPCNTMAYDNGRVFDL
jgi:hypothetical protein